VVALLYVVSNMITGQGTYLSACTFTHLQSYLAISVKFDFGSVGRVRLG